MRSGDFTLSGLSEVTVWRVELRAAKRHLKDSWHVASWTSLYEMLPRIYATMLEDFRYSGSTTDSNRSRWPTDPIWQQVSEIVRTNLFDHVPALTPEEYVKVTRQEKLKQLEPQILGLLVGHAAVAEAPERLFKSHAMTTVNDLVDLAMSPNATVSLEERFEKAKKKYRFLV